ncbi:MAG TPA: S49 family peptidase [Burkholderiales bacterium]|nr:S49 family peptidase [Burkholderiales bacterium]
MATDELLTGEAPLAFQLLSLNDRPWAMSLTALRSLVAACGALDFEAVAARAGQPLDNGSGVMNYHGTAVVNIRGPLFRYRSIWTWLLGGTSVEQTALALHAAVDDPTVQRIVLAINSPGGQIDGINELANMIRTANQTKPITAYVDGQGASAAYWLASAAGTIVADETARLGSIGVRATVFDERAAEEKQGVKRYEIISSQSPLKRTDPGTDQGRAQLQQMVDAMAAVFIAKVAEFRGTSEEKVVSDFGQGAELSARDAVSVGMAEALGSLEGLLGAGNGDPVRVVRDQPALRVGLGTTVPAAVLHIGAAATEPEAAEETDDEECDCPPGEDCECDEEEQEPLDSSASEGDGDLITPTEERQRIAAILTCEEARGREELARTLALETNHTLEAAQKLLKACPLAVATKPVNALEVRMGQIQNPNVGVSGDAVADDSPAAEVQRILAFVPKSRRHAVQ